jgi:hypothetical protein
MKSVIVKSHFRKSKKGKKYKVNGHNRKNHYRVLYTPFEPYVAPLAGEPLQQDFSHSNLVKTSNKDVMSPLKKRPINLNKLNQV